MWPRSRAASAAASMNMMTCVMIVVCMSVHYAFSMVHSNVWLQQISLSSWRMIPWPLPMQCNVASHHIWTQASHQRPRQSCHAERHVQDDEDKTYLDSTQDELEHTDDAQNFKVEVVDRWKNLRRKSTAKRRDWLMLKFLHDEMMSFREAARKESHTT